MKKPQPIFSVLAEGGSLSISRITIDGQYRYLTRHQEADLTEEGLGINRQIGYGSFDEAFSYIRKYPWHLLCLETVHEDYRIRVLDLLMEAYNDKSRGGRYDEQRKRHEHEQLLGASICRDVSGWWSYTLEDNKPSPGKRYKK